MFKEEVAVAHVDGSEESTVELHNAVWRSGPDRGRTRSSNNLAESSNDKLKAGIQNVTAAMLEGQSSNSRPSLPELRTRVENFVQIDEQINPRHQEPVLHRYPVGVDQNQLTGHPSIKLHTQRLPAKAWVARMGA